jgi:hypothetical protein
MRIYIIYDVYKDGQLEIKPMFRLDLVLCFECIILSKIHQAKDLTLL